jgi:hypothetical protein
MSSKENTEAVWTFLQSLHVKAGEETKHARTDGTYEIREFIAGEVFRRTKERHYDLAELLDLGISDGDLKAFCELYDEARLSILYEVITEVIDGVIDHPDKTGLRKVAEECYPPPLILKSEIENMINAPIMLREAAEAWDKKDYESAHFKMEAAVNVGYEWLDLLD